MSREIIRVVGRYVPLLQTTLAASGDGAAPLYSGSDIAAVAAGAVASTTQ